MVQVLDEKPALIVYRTNRNDFTGFLNEKALSIVKKLNKGAKYLWLDICYFRDRKDYFIELCISEEKQSYAISDNTPPSEPGSHTSYPYGELKDEGCFEVARVRGIDIFSRDYYGQSFKIFFVEEGLLETSQEQKAIYFKEGE